MAKRRSPLVTVIIPTHNRANVLDRAIESVLSQSYPRIETIVVDDRSTDETEQVVRRYADQDVRYLKNEGRRGASATRNVGIRAARGRLIAFLDSDDEWLPDKISLQVKKFAAGPTNLGLVHCGVTELRSGRSPTHFIPKLRGKVFQELLIWNFVGSASRIMIPRQILLDLGGFNESFQTLNDWEMTLRIARDYLVDLVPEPCVLYHFDSHDHLSLRARSVFLSHRLIFKTYGTDYYPNKRKGVHFAYLANVLSRMNRKKLARRLIFQALLLAPTNRTVQRFAFRMFVPRHIFP